MFFSKEQAVDGEQREEINGLFNPHGTTVV